MDMANRRLFVLCLPYLRPKVVLNNRETTGRQIRSVMMPRKMTGTSRGLLARPRAARRFRGEETNEIVG